MNREILFRGKRKDNGEWIQGYYITLAGVDYIFNSANWFERVLPETVGQFTGLKDKNERRIYEGDMVRFRVPYRTTQTHTGDNIPNGSYTEPMEPGINEFEADVVFDEGTFYLEYEQGARHSKVPIIWQDVEWNEPDIKEAISWRKSDSEIWDDPEEGNLQWLLQLSKTSNIEELVKYLSGLEVIGNIHTAK